jgi:hypothetical protein
MVEAASIPRFRSRTGQLADEALYLSLGAGLTFVLFMGIAHFEMVKPAEMPVEIEDLRAVAAVSEPPPPRPDDRSEPIDAVPLTGIDIGASDSPVKLAVVPPDLSKLMPPADLPPRATIQFGQLMSDLRPKNGNAGEFQHIYQQSEVDQPPLAVVKTIAQGLKPRPRRRAVPSRDAAPGHRHRGGRDEHPRDEALGQREV